MGIDVRRRQFVGMVPLATAGIVNAFDGANASAATQQKSTNDTDILNFTAQDGGRSRAVYHRPAGRMPKTAAILMHPRASQTHHFVANPLATGGYGVLGCASRSENNDSDALQEATLLDIAAAIKTIKEQHQVQRIVAIGHSGGAGLFAFYQVQATTKPPGRFASAPSGNPPDLNKFELPLLDGFITLNGHRGEGPSFLEMLDPSIVDESDVGRSDPTLDLFDPRNGFG